MLQLSDEQLLNFAGHAYRKPENGEIRQGFSVFHYYDGILGINVTMYGRRTMTDKKEILEIVIAFAGTESDSGFVELLLDWRNNLQFWPTQYHGLGIHRGFLSLLLNDIPHGDLGKIDKGRIYDEIHKHLKELISEHSSEARQQGLEFECHIYCTGHSQGGALAQIFHVISPFYINHTVTFNSPRVFTMFTWLTAKLLVRSMKRMVNYHARFDIVGHVPFFPLYKGVNRIKRWGWKHNWRAWKRRRLK